VPERAGKEGSFRVSKGCELSPCWHSLKTQWVPTDMKLKKKGRGTRGKSREKTEMRGKSLNQKREDSKKEVVGIES